MFSAWPKLIIAPRNLEQVRAALLDGARRMVAEAGIAALRRAGRGRRSRVTTGALLPSLRQQGGARRCRLRRPVRGARPARSTSRWPPIRSRSAASPAPMSDTVFRTDERHQSPPLAGLWISAMADEGIRSRWAGWLADLPGAAPRDRRRSAARARPLRRRRGLARRHPALRRYGDRAALRARLISQTRPEG